MFNFTALLALSAVFACNDAVPTGPGPGDTPSDQTGPYCDVTVLPVDSDDAVLGYSADDILAFSDGEFSTNLVWFEDETSVPFDLTISYLGGPIELIDQEPLSSTGGPSDPIDVECTDSLSIEVELSFSTPDGTFNENTTTNLSVQSSDHSSFYLQYDANAFSGTYDFDQADPSTYSSLVIIIAGSIHDVGHSTGYIQARGEWESGSSAGLDSFNVATWPAEEVE
jgi:hypothetical protein